ncbi:MAG: metallopeptidase TldD-related protein [Gammaproteobacteria bacterium]
MRAYFDKLAECLQDSLKPGEIFTCYFAAEESDFVRLNKNRVGQAGHVRQLTVDIDLINGLKHAPGVADLSGNIDDDRRALAPLIDRLRSQRATLEDDPHLLYATNVQCTEAVHDNTLPASNDAIQQIVDAGQGLDLVGIWVSGPLYRGFANSLGQRNWYQNASFMFDWSCYVKKDRAVKSNYAGVTWHADELHGRMRAAREQLETLGKTPKSISPGKYRSYIAPAALQELIGMVNWGGFGLKSHRTRQTPLLQMIDGDRRLHPAISISEATAVGLAPAFTASGFIKPSRVSLIDGGQYKDCLVSPRSAREYDVPVNAGSEFPESLDMAAGDIDETHVADMLGNGLWLSNLWYCNFSDRSKCRITGMTRYACFWVEDGKLASPINAMRFDESIYRTLGTELAGLTRERQHLLSANTYGSRSTSSMRLPGALTGSLTLTL